MAWTARNATVYLTHTLIPKDTPLGATAYLDVEPGATDEVTEIADLLDVTTGSVLSAVARHIRYRMQPSPDKGLPGFPGPCRLLPRGVTSTLNLTRFMFMGMRLTVTFTTRTFIMPCGTHYFRIEVQGVER